MEVYKLGVIFKIENSPLTSIAQKQHHEFLIICGIIVLEVMDRSTTKDILPP